MARGGGFGAAQIAPEKRRQVERNLRRVDPTLHGFKLRRAVDACFESYARYWADTLRLPSVEPDELDEGLTYEGYEHIVRARAQGLGPLMVLPHLGGWEWAAFWLTRLDNKTKNRGDVMINFSESSENVRTKTNHVQVFRMFRSMMARFPSKTEYFALLDPITNNGKVLTDAAKVIRLSAAYDARV